ncbi:hypothetical protein ACRQ5Q_43590 (plasmid) [Bradyrhizobium sp. PMVTL-01]|uniref:hypothetical protein n=1 Tax=Bradyrhizobium sp. PMVTL-01 TaxID=3434999 RepID=UPI003F6FA297
MSEIKAHAHRVTCTTVLPFSAPAHRPDGERIFPSELEFFRLVADHQALASRNACRELPVVRELLDHRIIIGVVLEAASGIDGAGHTETTTARDTPITAACLVAGEKAVTAGEQVSPRSGKFG